MYDFTMKFLIQRVSSASVHIVDTATNNNIWKGFVVYMGISVADLEEDRKAKVDKFVRRVGKLGLFSKQNNKKSVSLQEIWWELLIISNFTLYGRNKKWGTIDFCHAAPYDRAEEVYNYLLEELKKTKIPFQTGRFGAMMEVNSTNVGPVNVMLEW